MQLLKNFIKKYFSSFAYFYRYLGYRLFVVVGLSILIGILDAFGLTMFLPLLELADGNSAATGKNLGNLSFVVTWLNSLGLELNLIVALSVLFIFFLLKGIVNYLSSIYKVIVNQYFAAALRLKLTDLFTRFSFKTFVTSDMGRIQNSFTGEISRVTAAYNAYSACMQQLFMILVYMVFVFLIDWKFAFLVCLGGFLTNLMYNSIYKKTKKESVEITKKNSNYHGLIIQYINNFKYLKATGFLTKYSEKLKQAIKNIEVINKKIGILNAQVSASREPLLISVVCIVIIIQVYWFKGQLAPILMSLLLFYRALTSVMAFQKSYNSFLGTSGALENIASFEKELKQASEKDGTTILNGFNENIKISNGKFNYGTTQILKDINLTIQKNQTVAFVGESGSGKTTLVNLISGLLRLDSGSITIDGNDLNDIKSSSFQSRIGYIAQESVIFNDTIFNNVTFWAEPTSENKKRFEKAIKKASIDTFVNELDNKENALLGNNGINLSGGQKQRISIARELYKDIDILILDEASSALDSETEKEIQTNIDNLKGNYTIIIVAHRLSTIKNVDIIYLMDKGQLIGQGSFEELTSSSERFRKMVELQEI